MELKDQIDTSNVPRHIAIIMDGNGRWAKQRHQPRVFGHKSAVKSVRHAIEGAAEIGVQYLTLYAFSTENWKRPKLEVTALMELLVSTIHKEVKSLMENDIQLKAIGDIEGLPKKCQKELKLAIDKTARNTKMTLILALSYSSRWEILKAVQKISGKVKDGDLSPEAIDETVFNEHLTTAEFPEPELMIRTSGEQRISNFLLWQLAYAELYFTATLWPDFRKDDLWKAILDYQNRERRFGLTSEQLRK